MALTFQISTIICCLRSVNFFIFKLNNTLFNVENMNCTFLGCQRLKSVCKINTLYKSCFPFMKNIGLCLLEENIHTQQNWCLLCFILPLGRYHCWWTISPRVYHVPSSQCFGIDHDFLDTLDTNLQLICFEIL